jgi:tripartite-type tricarboxylate transporter receptor subunit TctC
VGYTAGGAVDVVARTIGQNLSASLGQPVIVENKPGAGTNIAVRSLIDSPPDGYTLMLTANALAANMALYHPAPFDAERDVVPVSLVGRVPVVIAAKSDSAYTSLQRLVQDAKAHPGTVNYASPGNGSTPHLAIEMFAHAAGIQLSHIPYKGGSQAITDVLGGQVSLVARGEVELGFQQLSELVSQKGIEVVGPLPPDIQAITIFSGAVCGASARRTATSEFLSFVASSDADEAKRRHGMEPAPRE